MNPAIIKRLELCSSLPSLPAAATRIVELARDPACEMSEVADAVRTDPALAAKLLKMANSPLYARRRRCESFQQALVLLGMNGTLTLALTFTLVSGMNQCGRGGLDYTRFWRRSLLAATAARVLGGRFGIRDVEDVFLAALMQDLGMLALDVEYPDLYASLPVEAQEHEALCKLERSHLDVDHADVGGWLLERWNLPTRLVSAVSASHRLQFACGSDQDSRFSQVVALSGRIADVWMVPKLEDTLRGMHQVVAQVEGVDSEDIIAVLESVAQEAPEVEAMFEMELLDQCRCDWVLQEAREMLVFRNLQMVQESAALREVAASLKAQATALEEKSRLDKLTGAFNRGHLDVTLLEWFAEAQQRRTPLSLVFLDLDDFKKVNDRFGHHAGDEVLGRFGDTLKTVARASDMVGRYGGEEFVLLLRDCGADGARRICDRLLALCRSNPWEMEDGRPLVVTASMGVATHGEQVLFENGMALIRAADSALYKAKQAGKNRYVEHDVQADAA